MISTKQQQLDVAACDTNGNVYQLQPASPSAPNMSSRDDNTAKHVPMAVPVPVDSPSATKRNEFPRRVASSEYTPWVLQVPMLFAFHLGNFVLATAAFILVVTLFSLSIGLLPLCCFGVVVFQITAWVTEYSARLDVALANLIIFSGKDEKLRVHPRIASGFTAPNRDDLVSKMMFLSPPTIGTMLYFMTIKFAVGILSCTVAACILGVPVCAITMATGSSRTEFIGFTYTDHPVEYVLSAIGIFVFGLWLLPIIASLSWKLTELTCAEKKQDSSEAGARYV